MSEEKRGRGRPKKIVEESPTVEQTADSLAVEETATQAKARQYKEDKKAKEKLNWNGKKYYYLEMKLNAKGIPDKKIILVREKTNGAKYRSFVGWLSKNKDFFEKVKSQGLVSE